jgi:hypothetical protein
MGGHFLSKTSQFFPVTGVRKKLDSARKKMGRPFFKLDAQWKKLRCARKKVGGQSKKARAALAERIQCGKELFQYI